MSPHDDLDVALRALAHADRRAIVALLAGQRLPSGEVAARIGLPVSTCSEHLRVLRAAGLVELQARGTWRLYAAAPAQVRAVAHDLTDLVTSHPEGARRGTTDRPLRYQRS